MTDHLHALPSGHRLNQYRIERVLGAGGFGITYYAIDTDLHKPVAIKEYLPSDCALRIDAITVHPKSTANKDQYEQGLKRFTNEVRALARFKHPHINKVKDLILANNTAYIVLEYIEGETLSEVLKRDNHLDAPRLRRLLDELLSGLEEVHGAGLVHRDIKPSNIMLRPDGSAVLLDFGAAHQTVEQISESISTRVYTPGYAPIEQYDRKAEDVGPWSDFYALGMVAYRCITGLGDGEMPDAVTRMLRKRKEKASLVPAVEAGKGRYEESLLQAVDWALHVDQDQRPQSVAEWREMLADSASKKAGDIAPPLSDHLHALPRGHRLGAYRIERVLSTGGFTTSYYALDVHLNRSVEIQEYLPSDFALRSDASTVHPKSAADRGNYQRGLQRFHDAAQVLACFDHPHIIKVKHFFVDNGTAYIVLEYIEGEILSQVLQRDNRLDAPRLRRLLDELLSSLEAVHGAGYIHCDIKPANIMLRLDGSAVLLDFGIARQIVEQTSEIIAPRIYTPGYAAIEQYSEKAKDLGPWSDFYALGRVAYRCITGLSEDKIPDALTRKQLEHEGKPDFVPAVKAGKGQYEESLLQAVDWAFRVDKDQRPQSVAALREMLAGG